MAANHPLNARQQKILDHINVRGSAQIRDFTGVLEVSEATIRRDLDEQLVVFADRPVNVYVCY